MIKVSAIAALSLLLLSSTAFAQSATGYPAVDSPDSATTGPSSAPQKTTGSSHASGKTGGNAQTCTDSCNRSFDGCMDQDSAMPGNDETLRNSNSAVSNLIGAASDCKDDLRKCLNTCGG